MEQIGGGKGELFHSENEKELAKDLGKHLKHIIKYRYGNDPE